MTPFHNLLNFTHNPTHLDNILLYSLVAWKIKKLGKLAAYIESNTTVDSTSIVKFVK